MISVIIGIHRFDNFVPEAIESILGQTLSELELIIIANGKECEAIEKEILLRYGKDSRVKVLKSTLAQLAHALNLGIDHARYEYIARMDADDIAWPERLEKQLNYLHEHSLDLVGSDLRLINERGDVLGVRSYPKGEHIAWKLRYKNCFAHNTILVKKHILIEARGYNAGFNSEDYDLWLRLLRQNIAWDNMPLTLVDYRVHDAASQRRLLGYAESTALAMREFVLKKTAGHFFAILYHFTKALFRTRK